MKKELFWVYVSSFLKVFGKYFLKIFKIKDFPVLRLLAFFLALVGIIVILFGIVISFSMSASLGEFGKILGVFTLPLTIIFGLVIIFFSEIVKVFIQISYNTKKTNRLLESLIEDDDSE